MPSDPPMAEALRAAVLGRTERLAKRLRKAARVDVDAVHDARATLRRLRQVVDLAGDLQRKPAWHIARDLRRLVRRDPTIRISHAGAQAQPTRVRHFVGRVIATLRALQQRFGGRHDRAVSVETTARLVRKGKVKRRAAIDLRGPALRDAIATVALRRARALREDLAP